MSKDTATGVNIYTSGEDPKLGEDADYPDWLWTLCDTPKTLKQLAQQADKGGVGDMTNEDFFRMEKLKRKAKIKEHNRQNAKKS